MDDSLDKNEAVGTGTAVVSEDTAPLREQVLLEPVDEHGIILLETRIAPDGTKRTRKVTKRGWPVLTIEEMKKRKCKYPPEPDSTP